MNYSLIQVSLISSAQNVTAVKQMFLWLGCWMGIQHLYSVPCVTLSKLFPFFVSQFPSIILPCMFPVWTLFVLCMYSPQPQWDSKTLMCYGKIHDSYVTAC